MSKKEAPAPLWLDEPENHDYPAARDYLDLLLETADVEALVARLDAAPTTHKKAKDILRASRLTLLTPDDKHVSKDLKKIAQGKNLSPVLLVRGSLNNDVALTIADGYHRVCASYWTDVNTDIPCKLVDLL